MYFIKDFLLCNIMMTSDSIVLNMQAFKSLPNRAIYNNKNTFIRS
jgi:hypothetical protein